uniref:Uncharacterized protein n=1 Tax=Lotus japonicus TaxID=34305 RepID=I3S1M3_LOTJA|nr:unknown [Lotus japonicus]
MIGLLVKNHSPQTFSFLWMRMCIVERPLLSFVVIHLETSILWFVFPWEKVICQVSMKNSSASLMLLSSVVPHYLPKNWLMRNAGSYQSV